MTRRVAVIGAGMAGASCARVLADAGWQVQVIDKSRGVGGRLATRRVDGLLPADHGSAPALAFDHGAPAFTARTPEFQRFVAQAAGDGLLARWRPRLAPGSAVPLDTPDLWLALPDMPALCRSLLQGLRVATRCTVDALRPVAGGWQVLAGGQTVAEADRVVLALPLPQAAPLLQPHQPDWAHRALTQVTLPAWTLMALTDAPPAAAAWDVAWPGSGPLAWVLRQDSRPGRPSHPGLAPWVLHASADWSRTHLEAEPAAVQAALQQALERLLGQPLAWRHVAVHRWRHATTPRADAAAPRCWWSAAGLGVCSDALAGAGVESAWLSGQALARALLQADAAPPLRAPRNP